MPARAAGSRGRAGPKAGAEFHDARAPQTRNQVVLDWLDTIIG